MSAAEECDEHLWQFWNGKARELADKLGAALARVEASERREAELREALAFYRDGFRYHPRRSSTGINLSEWKPTEALLDDCGELARTLLNKEGEK